MIDMTAAINEHNFEGKQEVRCFTCHEGHGHPLSRQLFADEIEAEKVRAEKEAAERGRPSNRRLPVKLRHLNTKKIIRIKMTRLCFVLGVVAFSAAHVTGQNAPKITTPKEALGFNIGDDYQIANYTQLDSYWHKLAGESDRMKLVDIGPTAENRRQYMAIITSTRQSQKIWIATVRSQSAWRWPKA